MPQIISRRRDEEAGSSSLTRFAKKRDVVATLEHTTQGPSTPLTTQILAHSHRLEEQRLQYTPPMKLPLFVSRRQSWFILSPLFQNRRPLLDTKST